MSSHLPALQVVLPLLAAPIIVLLRNERMAHAITVAVSWVSLAISIALLAQVAQSGPISYAIGGWAPPWGIEYRVDYLSGFVLVLVSLTASIVAPYSRVSIAAEIPRDQEYLLYAMFNLCLTGLLGIAITGDVFNVFVFLEISSLSTYVMIALGARRNALLAAYQYLIMGTIGATFYVIGIGLLYLMTGTLNMVDMAERLRHVDDMRPLLAAFAFITAGIGLKLALFPLHQWLPNAYAFAPSVVTAFLSATATKVSVYILLRFYYTVFGPSLGFNALATQEVLIILSVAGIVIASLIAIFQPDLKRMFAYSSVAQISYITLGIALANPSGLTAAIVHLLNHGVTKAALFLLLGGVALRYRTTSIDRLKGMGRCMPLTSFAMVIGGLSLIGVPGTAGFITKWYLVLGAIERGYWWLAAVIVASSLLAVAYVWRFVEAAYLSPPDDNAPRTGEAPWSMLFWALLLALGCVYLGLETSYSVGIATEAAKYLLETSR